MYAPPEESSTNQQHQMNMVFANHSKEDVIYLLTVKDIALAQEDNSVLKKLSKTNKYHLIGRGYTSPMQRWQDGHPQSSSVKSS